ncbi:hypothetical protein HQ587_10535 [bacterium]|nr:hypothetical protein [bacterium]
MKDRRKAERRDKAQSRRQHDKHPGWDGVERRTKADRRKGDRREGDYRYGKDEAPEAIARRKKDFERREKEHRISEERRMQRKRKDFE